MKYLTIIFFATAFALISCGDDDTADCNETTFSAEFQEELNNISDAVTAYSANPNEDTCEDLKEAYNDYIDALELWEDCANELNQATEWEQAIEEARDEVDTIC